jgi:hypothetical protein
MHIEQAKVIQKLILPNPRVLPVKFWEGHFQIMFCCLITHRIGSTATSASETTAASASENTATCPNPHPAAPETQRLPHECHSYLGVEQQNRW